MSLDIQLAVPLQCPKCNHFVKLEYISDFNITHNLGALWSALTIYDELYNSEGKRASDIVEALEKALYRIMLKPSYYEQFEPGNGWGTVTDAINFLKNLVHELLNYPDSIIGIDK